MWRSSCKIPFITRDSVVPIDGLPYGGRAPTNGESNPMTTSRDQALADLRQSIDTLPERTRRAMLTGLGNNTVITGAFSDGANGACPMLAAQREGNATRCMGFPEAWDRFTGVFGRSIARPATQYEVLQLRMQLEESLSM